MANIVYIATSLDGYIADKDGGVDWLHEVPNPSKSDFGFSEFMKRIDALVMGRKTYETVMSFGHWPYAKKVFVLSNTLREVEVSLGDKAEVIKGELKDIVSKLNERGFKSLYIDGGKTVQSFLKENLIDEIIITRIPIILGSGIALFDNMDLEIKFEHVETEILNNSLVKSRYTKKK